MDKRCGDQPGHCSCFSCSPGWHVWFDQDGAKLRDKKNWGNEAFRDMQNAEALIKAKLKDKYGIDNPIFD